MRKDEFDGCIFRFRGTDKVLEYNELRNTEIYFCPYNQEDDRTEGSLNLYWQADGILWDNFFAHYFVVFATNYLKMMLLSEEKRKKPEEICLLQMQVPYKINAKYIDEFMDNEIVKAVRINASSDNHRVKEGEIHLYLDIIHEVALNIVRGLLSDEHKDVKMETLSFVNALEDIRNIIDENTEGIFRKICHYIDIIKQEIQQKEYPDWYRWLVLDFPDAYFDELKKQVFPKWYLASFCDDCTNVRQWSEYADKYKGVCFVFKTHPFSKEKNGIGLYTCHKFSSN